MIEEADYSQTWVAQHMGISTKHLSQICTGNAMPGVNATIAFAQLMDASPMLLWRLSCDHRLALALGKKDLTSEYV
jgi:plasmid maintenance system antidote protein VapI